MNTNILAKNYITTVRQRNLFLALLILAVFSQTLISLKLFLMEEKIIMVPGLEKELYITNSQVSKSYLEQMTHSFVNALLDITPNDIQYKKQIVLKFTSHTAVKDINDYFSQAEEEYKKFDLATHYTIKNLNIDPINLQVITHGILTSWYGKTGHESKVISYNLAFEFISGQLRLKGFSKIEGEKK